MKEGLVSIIVPVYNAEKYIEDTIKTVHNQTYKNYELIMVNDCSTDNSLNIIKQYQKQDKRIIIINNKKNCGAAQTRNNGIKKSQGEFICFLDADDKWNKSKLEKQLEFMKEMDCEFSYTSYQFCNAKCEPIGSKVIVPKTINYKQALKNTTIFTSTVMLDMKKLSKEDIFMPNVRRGQDTATWWKLLRTKVEKAYGMQEILSYYRRVNQTLSSNKFKALKRTWNLYRRVEKLNIIKSIYYFNFYILNAVRRRIKCTK